MKTTKEHVTKEWYTSELYPIESCEPRDKEIIEWLDKNPVAFEIVTKNKSKAFGKKSCVYIGWAQNNNSVRAVIEKLRTLKYVSEAKAARFSSPGDIFQYRAQFTLKHYKDKGFTGGFFQQLDKRYQRDCLSLDYTPALLDEVIAKFEEWMDDYHITTQITIDGETVRRYKKEGDEKSNEN